MARPRKDSAVYAALQGRQATENLWREFDHKVIDKGLQPGSAALSGFCDVSDATVRNYRNGKREMQIRTFISLVQGLKPDIGVVLRYLGYSDNEILRFLMAER